MTRSTLLTAGAMLSFAAAALVMVFGVIATSGVYGSRMAWLLGVALPLLVITMLLARVAPRPAARVHEETPSSPGHAGPGLDGRRTLFVAALVLLGIPVALAGTLLSAYAFIFVVHGISLLL